MNKLLLIFSFLFVSFIANAQKIPSWKIADVAAIADRKSDSVYVINFWATYCKPCIGEIPYLQSIVKKYSRLKVKLLLVSMDLPSFYPHKIKKFTKENNYTADIVWLDESDPNHFCPVIDKQWMATMPATLFVNQATGYKKFVNSSISEEQFEKELRKAVGKD